MSLFRRRPVPALRNYLYISDSKLDMLSQQIERGVLRRISAEVKVDLKLASVTLRQAGDQAPATRMAKLRVVERFIEEHHQVGTIEEPGREYFRGRMDMQWGWLDDWTATSPRPEENLRVVFFKGREQARFVVLGGSRRHVLGEHPAGADAVAHADSMLPSILAAIGAHISDDPQIVNRVGDLRSREAALFGAASLGLTVPTQSLEFLAVPLLEGQIPGQDPNRTVHGVLGTPLYVATSR